eukprot:TRINITY_DN384_c0_g3_i1.p1 TRINITY_DN384_c0_g3~~TRINITY_DN384_c0_g3_i1.p1  ORF type:complete len:186 (-),score=20.28 TRINITY_DN384_c0_g3_i1:69-626(-)
MLAGADELYEKLKLPGARFPETLPPKQQLIVEREKKLFIDMREYQELAVWPDATPGQCKTWLECLPAKVAPLRYGSDKVDNLFVVRGVLLGDVPYKDGSKPPHSKGFPLRAWRKRINFDAAVNLAMPWVYGECPHEVEVEGAEHICWLVEVDGSYFLLDGTFSQFKTDAATVFYALEENKIYSKE